MRLSKYEMGWRKVIMSEMTMPIDAAASIAPELKSAWLACRRSADSSAIGVTAVSQALHMNCVPQPASRSKVE